MGLCQLYYLDWEISSWLKPYSPNVQLALIGKPFGWQRHLLPQIWLLGLWHQLYYPDWEILLPWSKPYSPNEKRVPFKILHKGSLTGALKYFVLFFPMITFKNIYNQVETHNKIFNLHRPPFPPPLDRPMYTQHDTSKSSTC